MLTWKIWALDLDEKNIYAYMPIYIYMYYTYIICIYICICIYIYICIYLQISSQRLPYEPPMRSESWSSTRPTMRLDAVDVAVDDSPAESRRFRRYDEVGVDSATFLQFLGAQKIHSFDERIHEDSPLTTYRNQVLTSERLWIMSWLRGQAAKSRKRKKKTDGRIRGRAWETYSSHTFNVENTNPTWCTFGGLDDVTRLDWRISRGLWQPPELSFQKNVCYRFSRAIGGVLGARMTGMKQTMKRLTMDMPEIQRVSWIWVNCSHCSKVFRWSHVGFVCKNPLVDGCR